MDISNETMVRNQPSIYCIKTNNLGGFNAFISWSCLYTNKRISQLTSADVHV